MARELKPEYPVFKVAESDDQWELILGDAPVVDINGKTYQRAGEFLENDDFYQGLCKISVIRDEAGNLYGYSYWDDISKHGESYIESNGDEFGLEGYCSVEDDWDTYVSFYVFEPVEAYPITAYKKV